MSSEYELYVVVAPGLESLAAQELTALGLKEVRVGRGGLTLKGTLEEAARMNLWLRTATRVLVRVGTFDAPGRRELAARAKRFPWELFVAPGTPIRIQVSCSASRLYHTGLVSEVLHESLVLPDAGKNEEAPTLFVRIVKDRCTLSFDTSGELLYKRGARQEISRAPLRETLAAALLLSAGFDGEQSFLDPACGSGALVLEAGSIAARRAPGLERLFALESFPSFDADFLTRLRSEARERIRRVRVPIVGSDLHSGALAQARRNAERAGIAEDVVFERVDVAARQAPAATGVLAVNPPWGLRVEADPAMLGAIRTAMSTTFRHWTRAVVAPAPLVARLLPKTPTRAIAIDDGGVKVQLAHLSAESAE